jgi:hypothetical protein
MTSLQPAFGGGSENCGGCSGGDVFVAKLNSTGSSLVYSTYLGGSGNDIGNGIAVDGDGGIYLTGYTGSADFPTMYPFQPANPGGVPNAFVTKINPAGLALTYSTYLGGSGLSANPYWVDFGSSIAVDESESAYVSGFTGSRNFPTTPHAFHKACNGNCADSFTTELDPAGSTLVYSTYLGGGQLDQGNGIALDSAGSA